MLHRSFLFAIVAPMGLVLLGVAILTDWRIGSAQTLDGVRLEAAPALAETWPKDVRKALRLIKAKSCQKRVSTLASDAYEGRAVGTEGGRAAGEYVARAFEDAGLQPGGTFGRYFQPFSVRGARTKEGSFELSNHIWVQRKPGGKREAFRFGKDFWPDVLSFEGRAKGRGLLISPQSAAEEAMRDKVGIVDGEPTRETVESWQKAGLLGLIVVPEKDPAPPSDPDNNDELTDWPRGELKDALAIPIMRMTRSAAGKLLSKCGGNLKSAPVAGSVGVPLKRGSVVVDVSRRGYMFGRGRNVIGVLPGSDPKRAEEVIVIGAHYDHVGRPRDPRLTRGRVGEIHNGADDNASGTTGLIEMATAFGESGLELPRTVVFIAFDAEESGLLGSHYYTLDPPKYSMKQTVAMINMDMISRNGPREMKIGKDARFAGLNRIVEDVAASVKVILDPSGMEQYIKRSDQWPFMEKGVPAVFIYGGDHADYHTENDDPDKINPVKIADITKLMFLAAYRLSHHEGTFGDGS